jgi:Ca-activated chloride channel family protein
MFRTLLLAWASGLGVSLLLMLGIGLWPTAVSAEPVSLASVNEGSLFMVDREDNRVSPAPLLNTRVAMDITGIVARVKVDQAFHNTTDRWQEGVYVFPLPDDAAVDHMRLWIGERFIEGEIRTRQEARREYQQAREEGRQASLLEQERANVFTTSVANIPPGERIRVEIEYQQTVRYDAGLFSLRFPMVVAPRYIPGQPITQAEISIGGGSGWAMDSDQVPDASRISPPVNLDVNHPVNAVSLAIRLHAGMPLSFIDSPYHPVAVTEEDEGEYRIVLEQGSIPANQDFVLNWQYAPGSDTSAAWFGEAREDGWYGLLMLVPPSVDTLPEPPAREVILVVDVSGSMEGDSIVQARAALQLAVSRLSVGDSFNIVRFNHEALALFGAPVPADEAHRNQALRWIQELRADGGTEMIKAMQLALDRKEHPGRLRQVIFLTDGDVGNEEVLFTVIQNKLGDSRLFTVGIGSAPNSYFMTRAAEYGRGGFTYIGDVKEVQEKMKALFLKLESPVLTGIAPDWGQQRIEQWPVVVPDLYAGEPVMLSVRAEQPLKEVSISGNANGEEWQQRLTLASTEDRPGLHVLWARRKIHQLMGQVMGGDTDALKKEIEKVALIHHLVSRYTSLVAVDKTPLRPVDAVLDTQAIPVEMPKGWVADAVFGRLPQTATPASLYLFLGLAGLLASVLLRRKLV